MAKELSEEVKAAIIVGAATLARSPDAAAGMAPNSTESLFELYDQIIDRLAGSAERLDVMRVGGDGDPDEYALEDADGSGGGGDGGAHEGADENDRGAA